MAARQKHSLRGKKVFYTISSDPITPGLRKLALHAFNNVHVHRGGISKLLRFASFDHQQY